MEVPMRRRLALSLILAAGAALAVPLAATAQAQQVDLASIAASGNFEFRGRHVMWKFTADGRVTADDSRIAPLVLGGSGEQFGIKKTGNWRRVGNRLFITWEGKGETAYTIAPGHGRMVNLVGDTTIEGTLDASGPPPSFAESPSRAAPGVTYPPSYRYQRVPGPR
jgi:hypothetical protein